MRIRILNKFWTLRFVPRMNSRGRCDAPWRKKKEIKVRSGLRGEEKLEVLLHELLHAADWHKDEEWVQEAAEDIARILTKLGYHD